MSENGIVDVLEDEIVRKRVREELVFSRESAG